MREGGKFGRGEKSTVDAIDSDIDTQRRQHGTTRHDTTRHDTTRCNTTRHNTTHTNQRKQIATKSRKDMPMIPGKDRNQILSPVPPVSQRKLRKAEIPVPEFLPPIVGNRSTVP
mmetsp:Transcript_3079/g.6647  ORF Transcript_3079/g.6647 Transcript_3079/m.6647 type:complete len:114 (-) Transcript_3079:225-566(-)